MKAGRAGRLGFHPTGQVVGQCNDERNCRSIVMGMMEEYIETVERLGIVLAEE